MSRFHSRHLAIIVFQSMLSLAGCGAEDDTEVVVTACSDLQSLKDDGQLKTGVKYGLPGIFSFELSSLTRGGQAEIDDCKALEKSLEGLVSAGVPGATLAYQTPSYKFVAARGKANTVTGEPMRTDGLFRIASVSKSYVGALVSLLAVEGRLDLDNSDGKHALADYLPETAGKIAFADRITVRQLIGHTSGIPDYFGGYGPAWLQLCLDRYHSHGAPMTEDDAMSIVYANPTPDFEPGTSAKYNNTGYILGTRIMTKVLGRPYQDEMRARFFAPLGITHSYWEKHDAFDRKELAHGYRNGAPVGEPDLDDWYDVDQGYGFANGGIVARIDDVLSFFHNIIGGQGGAVSGLDVKALNDMMLPAEEGLGVGIIRIGDCYLHGGEFTGYISGAFTCPARHTTGVIFGSSSEEPLMLKIDEVRETLMVGGPAAL